MTLLALTVLAAFAIYIMKPEERKRALLRVIDVVRRAGGAAARRAASRRADPFEEALKARTQWPLIVPAVVTYNAVVFVCMLFGSGAFADPDTLVAWGGNFGPRTTNGEWWRLVTSMFVHSGWLDLLVSLAALAQETPASPAHPSKEVGS